MEKKRAGPRPALMDFMPEVSFLLEVLHAVERDSCDDDCTLRQ